MKKDNISSMMDDLVDFALQADEIVPDDVRTIARLHLADTFGVGYAASQVGPLKDLDPSPQVLAASGPSQVFGREGGVAPTLAALLNGTLIHSLEFDDTHTESVMHGSSVLLPAVLAYCQAMGSGSSQRLINAYIVGWELLIRLGKAAPSQFQTNGFQGTAVAGTLAAALSTGVLANADRETLRNALAISASFSSGNFTFLQSGATSKAAQAGIAAQGGLSAFALAESGITGDKGFLAGEQGFFSIYAGSQAPVDNFVKETQTLGTEWNLRDAAFKGFPCCHFIHPFIEIAQDLRTQIQDISTLKDIRLYVPKGQEHVIALPWEARQNPSTAGEGRWSLPYVFALALLNHDVEIPDFIGTPVKEVVALANRISWEPWEDSGYPKTFPARAVVSTHDGRSFDLSVPDVKGNLTRPWTAADVQAKFTHNMSSAGASESYTAQVWHELVEAPTPDVTRL